MAYGVLVINESRRLYLDANRIAPVRNQFSGRVSECLGDKVLLYQSRSTKFVSGYFARATLLDGGVSTQDARFLEVILSDLEYLRVPVPFRAAGPVVEASVRNQDGTLNGRRFAEDFRIVSESEFFEIVGENFCHQDALAHNSIGFKNAEETARQKAVSHTWLRSATARALALPNYNYRCSITGQQLKSRSGVWTGLQVCHAMSVAGEVPI